MRRALFAIFLAAAMPLRAGFGPEIAMLLLPLQTATVWAPGDYYTPRPLARPSVASLGDGFVAAWLDGLSERVQVIDRDGSRATDNGTALATLAFDGSVLYPPVVASRGDSAAVVFAVSDTVYLRIVHANGKIDPAQAVANHGAPFIAATGDGYLVVLISSSGAAGQFVDAAGKPVGTKFTIDPQLTYFTAVASNGSGSLVVTRSFDRVKTWLVLPGGGVSPGAVFSAFQPTDLAVAWDGSQYVVAWSESDGAHVAAAGAPPHRVASGAVRDIVSSGAGATLVTQPPQFVRFAQGTTVAIATGSLDLPEAGAAAQNGSDVLVAGAQRLDGVIAGGAPFAIAFAPMAQNNPRVVSGGSLSAVAWVEGSSTANGYVARLARFTQDGILDVIDLPAVPMVLDASGFRIAIATIENGAIALRGVDPQGNLWPAQVLVPPPASSRTSRTLAGVVITPATTAVVWYDGLGPASLHVTFDRGPTIDLGTIDFNPGSVGAAWDGNAVVVAATVGGQVVVKAVGAEGVRWTRALSLEGATSNVAIASNRAGRTMVGRSRDVAVLDDNGAPHPTVRMSDQVTGSAAFDGSEFIVAAFRHLLHVATFGSELGSEDLPTPDWFAVSVAPSAIAYSRNSRVYVQSR